MSTTRRTAGVHSRPRPLGPNGERLCYNCLGPLPKGRPYNCSKECSEQWVMRTSPTYMRRCLFERDKGICALCGTDTTALRTAFDALVKENGKDRDYAARRKWLEDHGIPPSRSWSDWWDADHIVPVIEGGGECALENLRTLCIPCHKKETRELRRRMAIKSRVSKAENLGVPLTPENRESIERSVRSDATEHGQQETLFAPGPELAPWQSLEEFCDLYQRFS